MPTKTIERERPVSKPAGSIAASDEIREFALLHRKLINVTAIAVGDALTITLCLVVAGFIRWLWKGDHMVPTWGGMLVVAWWVGATAFRLLPGWGLGAAEELRRQVVLLTTVFFMTTAAVFLSKSSSEASRLTLTIGFLLGLVCVPLVRMQIKRFLLKIKAWGIPSVIYGNEEAVCLLIRAMQEERGLGYYPVGIFTEDRPAGAHLEDIPVLGGLRDRTRLAPVAFIGLPALSRHNLIEMLDGPLSIYRHAVIVPDLFEAPSLWVQPRDLRGILGLEVTSNLLDPMSRFVKRAVELVMVLTTAPVWVPLCLLIALLIWLEDRDGALYVQERVGQGGKLFKTWKFRTMHRDAEIILENKLDEDPDLREEWENNFKLRHDPRVTRIGTFLRVTSLDELPQCVNVLRGEMSLVGPRPLPAYHYYELPERVRKLRDRVRPGVTGLWQVSGRSVTGIKGMERWDTYYVRNWSIWLDIVILFRTIRAVFRREGAY